MQRQRKIAVLKLLIILKRRRAFLKKYWVRPTWANRAGESELFTAMKEMNNGDKSLFYMFYRMSPANFDVLHSLVQEKLTKDQCPSRETILSGERLALTWRKEQFDCVYVPAQLFFFQEVNVGDVRSLYLKVLCSACLDCRDTLPRIYTLICITGTCHRVCW
ncbi:hypothetical protein MRX96_009353 [Rhipicephalus microplus]